MIVWQKADQLFDMICDDVERFPENRVAWSISKQLIDSGGSVSANIAEGWSSGYPREYYHSLKIARKELGETLNWIFKCMKRKFISEIRFSEYEKLCEEIRKMINSLLSKL